MIEIFKTNVQQEKEATEILDVFLTKFPDLRINFDLTDCDRILRVCGHSFSNTEISELLHRIGYRCEVMED